VDTEAIMIEKLITYYKDKEIYPIGFNCKYLSSCISKAEKKEKFTRGHGIWVGTEYEKGQIPRLLFLSLDSGSAEIDPQKRTMEAARQWNEKWLPGKGDKPKHWYRTHQFAWHIFKELKKTLGADFDIGNVDDKYDFSPLTEIHKIKPYYAATNSAKCCMNNEQRSQANRILFENCRRFTLGEINILSPDILVTQGKYARLVAEGLNVRRVLQNENISKASTKEQDFHVLQLERGKSLVWIHHYHPNNYGWFKKNRDNYAIYAKKVAQVFGGDQALKKARTHIRTAREKIVSTDNKAQKKPTKQKPENSHRKRPVRKAVESRERSRSKGKGGQSLLAYRFYNEINYREGKPPDIIVSEIDRLFKQGKDAMKIDTLISIIDKRNPLLKENLKDVGDKIKRLIYWARSKGWVEFDGDEVRILPC